ncbi:MAG: tRNA pseudouridine(38-40) synthase TruA [Verrucomicrobia bacterium]|nr:tRNA pseudouridine(38-40) synthase TruA [Verrucomicrobiota bacterium]
MFEPLPVRNLCLTIAYDGTDYLGWQKTKEGPSIEAELQHTLEQILQHPVSLQAASRTDAGVHAEAQVVNFFTPHAKDLDRLQKSLNGLLSPAISVTDIAEMPTAFHPTLDCSGKEYHYHLCLGSFQLPQYRHYSWHYPYPLDVGAMQKAAPFLQGYHDFSAFTCEPQEDNHREVFSIEIEPISTHRLQIRVSGNRFLYKMVRSIVGTLVYVGCGKIEMQKLPSILASQDRKQAGVTAPAHGLTLKKVLYTCRETTLVGAEAAISGKNATTL